MRRGARRDERHHCGGPEVSQNDGPGMPRTRRAGDHRSGPDRSGPGRSGVSPWDLRYAGGVGHDRGEDGLPVGLLKYLTSDRELAEVGIDVTGMGHSTRVAARSASAPATRLSRSFQRR